MDTVARALALLTPYDVDIDKVRIGPMSDGGYVFVNRIDQSQAVLSYGIGSEFRFDLEMANRGHSVLMFDHTISGINEQHENIKFVAEGVAGQKLPAENLSTIEDHLDRFDVTGSDLILKMDVEGAEWDAICNTPRHVLRRFSQIVIEVHYLDRLEDVAFRTKYTRFFTLLNSLFTLFHVHANNHNGANGLHIVGGLPVSSLMELSYVRSDLCSRKKSNTIYPTNLDYPNVPGREKLLWFFPFVPTGKEISDFLIVDQRGELLHALYAERSKNK